MLGPFATASRRTPHCHSPGVATVARRNCGTPPAHRDPQQQRQRVTEGDHYGPIEWAQQQRNAIGTEYTQNSLAYKHFTITLRSVIAANYYVNFCFAVEAMVTIHRAAAFVKACMQLTHANTSLIVNDAYRTAATRSRARWQFHSSTHRTGDVQ